MLALAACAAAANPYGIIEDYAQLMAKCVCAAQTCVVGSQGLRERCARRYGRADPLKEEFASLLQTDAKGARAARMRACATTTD